jgi:hypothetical protein
MLLAAAAAAACCCLLLLLLLLADDATECDNGTSMCVTFLFLGFSSFFTFKNCIISIQEIF